MENIFIPILGKNGEMTDTLLLGQTKAVELSNGKGAVAFGWDV